MKTLIISFFTLFHLMAGCQNQQKDHAVTDNPTQTQQIAKVVNVSPDEFMDLQKSGAITVDVRTQEEVNDGYIDGATVFIDVYAPDFSERMNGLDKTKTYLVYCRSGRRSLTAAQFMVDNGFTQVYNLTPGILGWTGQIKK